MDKYLLIAEKWTDILENKFRIGPVRFGLDALFGLIPGGGDAVTGLLSLYLIWVANKVGIPQKQIHRMFLNIGIDMLIGLIPVLGDAGDFVFKANLRNMEILKKYANISVKK